MSLKVWIQTDATSQFYFTVMTLYSDSHQNAARLPQKNALPTHLNGNVSQSPRQFSLRSICVWRSIHLDGLSSSSAPLDRLVFIKTKPVILLIYTTLLKLATHVPPEQAVGLLEKRMKPIFFLSSLLLHLAGVWGISKRNFSNLEIKTFLYIVSISSPWLILIYYHFDLESLESYDIWKSVSKINSFYTAFTQVKCHLPSDISLSLLSVWRVKKCLVFHVTPVCPHFHWI